MARVRAAIFLNGECQPAADNRDNLRAFGINVITHETNSGPKPDQALN
jgi:hypothetical protein